LKLVVNFSGAAIFSIPDRSLISPDFHIQVDAKVAAEIVKPYQQPELYPPRVIGTGSDYFAQCHGGFGGRA
jgi:hypothetical protein